MSDDDELIVVDDGSTDGTEEALAPYADKIRYKKTPNCGAGRARNYGIGLAEKDLVAFLDSDDEWMPGKLALNRGLFAARDDVLFSFSNMAATLPDRSIEHRYLRFWHEDDRPWDEILGPSVPYSTLAVLPDGIDDFNVHFGRLFARMAEAPYMFTTTVVARRQQAGNALQFEEDLPLYEDWLCYGRLCQKGLAAYLDIETAWNHADASERLTDGDSLQKATVRTVVLERLWGHDVSYLSRYRDIYDELLSDQHCKCAASLIAMGKAAEARQHLKQADHPPWYLRPLSFLPGPIARGMAWIRAQLKRVIGKK